MKLTCPFCTRDIRTHDEKRYLPGNFQKEKQATVYCILYKFHCNGMRGCGRRFILQRSKMLDASLKEVTRLHEDFLIWNAALKTRPGMDLTGSTASEYTKLIHRDTAQVYRQVLRRSKRAGKK